VKLSLKNTNSLFKKMLTLNNQNAIIMKPQFYLCLILISGFFSAQSINYTPLVNFVIEGPYTVTISGNGAIYYTTDGSEPSATSPNAQNSVSIVINETTQLKAKLRYGTNSFSETFKKTYYIGSFPSFPIFFKPNAQFNMVCAYQIQYEPQTLIDFFWPGAQMQAACEGWYKTQSFFVEGTATFNNCSPNPPVGVKTDELFLNATVFYDFVLGPITNPPACLLASNEVADKIVSVKIFPNPVMEILRFETDLKFISYEILDVSGKLYERKNLRKNEVDVSKLTKGVYFLKLNTPEKSSNYIRFIKS